MYSGGVEEVLRAGCVVATGCKYSVVVVARTRRVVTGASVVVGAGSVSSAAARTVELITDVVVVGSEAGEGVGITSPEPEQDAARTATAARAFLTVGMGLGRHG